jgi:hypothetical protein
MKFFVALILSLMAFGAVAGCDDVKSERTVQHKTDDGTVVKEHKKVTENNEGDKKVTETKEVNRP